METGHLILIVIGLVAGMLGGLLGIGGGALAVPLQQLFLRMPLRQAIANSAATIVPLSLIGATCKNYANAQAGIPFSEATGFALFLIPTAMVGGYLGGRLTHLAPRRILRLAVILLMCYGGIGLIRRPVHTDSPPASAVGLHESTRPAEQPAPVMTGRRWCREPETRHALSPAFMSCAVRSSCASVARVSLAAVRPRAIDSTSSRRFADTGAGRRGWSRAATRTDRGDFACDVPAIIRFLVG